MFGKRNPTLLENSDRDFKVKKAESTTFESSPQDYPMSGDRGSGAIKRTPLVVTPGLSVGKLSVNPGNMTEKGTDGFNGGFSSKKNSKLSLWDNIIK